MNCVNNLLEETRAKIGVETGVRAEVGLWNKASPGEILPELDSLLET